MDSPPQTFDEDAYKEVLEIVEANASRLHPNTSLALAYLAGGAKLAAATSKLDFPPCGDNECSDCWVSKWCIHQDTPKDIRLELVNILGVLTDPKIELSDKDREQVNTLDKTDLSDISLLAELGYKYILQRTKAEDDKSKKRSSDPSS